MVTGKATNRANSTIRLNAPFASMTASNVGYEHRPPGHPSPRLAPSGHAAHITA